jgi:hypothetical protein
MVRALTAIRGGWRGRAAKVLTVAAAGLALYVAAGMGLPATAQALDAGERQRLAEALRAMDRDEWRWARKTVDGFGFRPLATYARWRELLEGDPKPGFAAYADFLARHRDWPSLGTLRTRAEEQIDEAVPHRDRLAFFQGGRQQPLTRQGRIRYAQALLEAGRRAEAAEALRRSWVVDDFPPSEAEYFLGLYREYLLAADHERRLDRLLWDGEITAAQRMLPLVRKSSSCSRRRGSGCRGSRRGRPRPLTPCRRRCARTRGCSTTGCGGRGAGASGGRRSRSCCARRRTWSGPSCGGPSSTA